jgi:hypothetical protein
MIRRKQFTALPQHLLFMETAKAHLSDIDPR